MEDYTLFRSYVLIFILLGSATTLSAEDSLFYRFRPGDELGVILFSLGFTRLWGKKGSVKDFASAQKDPIKGQGAKILDNGNSIEPGTWIEFKMVPPLVCNTSIFARKITHIKTTIKTSKDRKSFRCTGRSGSRQIASVPVKAIEKHGRLVVMPHVATGDFYFRAFLNSDTSETCEIDNLKVGHE